MRTVIYARYSPGANQTEQSIEGQLRECEIYAQQHNLTIVGNYIDRHLTGTNDNRPDFQRMMKDSDRHLFDAILMYKMDRFARNRYDSAIYKTRLKRNGVKIFYAKENIPDGPEGIILESLLEGMAEYYSAELSQKIKRGMRESAYKCHVTGGHLALGYSIADDKSFVINDDQAVIVRKIFEMYDAGTKVVDICRELNAQDVKTAYGAKFNKNSLRKLLSNEKYIGVYKCMGVREEGGVPAIVDSELFDRVQKRLSANQKAPARAKAKVDYLLSGKLYCGYCGAGMVGESGTGKSGQKHYYYICVNKKRERSCEKKTVRKEWIETVVARATELNILCPDKIDAIAKKCVEVQSRDTSKNTELLFLQKQLAETKKSIQNLEAAIEQGIITKTTKSRLTELEAAQERIEFEIDACNIKQPRLDEDQIKFMLSQFQRKEDQPDEDYLKTLIDCFIDNVYLFDDKIIVTYNLTNEKSELESSLLTFHSNPENPDNVRVLMGSDMELDGGGEPNRYKSQITGQIRRVIQISIVPYRHMS